ncbi:ABC transporter permease [Micromonospora sonchi]|uniref:ABC transporter permease n=1 Tax=Micromonospora sonchi TaxID=1763543 RepID=UPI001E462ACC|nr:ABC transporter permease [Micromonospora sonchi]
MRPVASREVDSRLGYLVFALAFFLGHGSIALSRGDDPALDLPTWLPYTLLAIGIVSGVTLNMIAGGRAQHGASESSRRSEKLVGTMWVTGFVALFLAISGLTTTIDDPTLQDALWPAGSVLVVGMINLAEGAVRRNTLHYGLGTWLTLLAAAALFFTPTGIYAALAIAGGTGYLVASLLERRRLANLPSS